MKGQVRQWVTKLSSHVFILPSAPLPLPSVSDGAGHRWISSLIIINDTIITRSQILTNNFYSLKLFCTCRWLLMTR